MKLLIVTLWIFCFSPVPLFAQWHDDFSDGDFGNNPAWQGNTGKFRIDNGWLRLDAPAAGTSYLSVASGAVTGASWEFAFRMDFNPSASNYAKVYLVADRANLTEPLNGYYLRLGSAGDDICLFRQNGNATEKLICGKPGMLDKTANLVRVLVTRDRQGYWTLKTDPEGGRNFGLEGAAADRQIAPSAFFGVWCTYTATRSAGFYFADFRVDGQPYSDTEPPVITGCSMNGSSVEIRFSEKIASVTPPYGDYFNVNNSFSPTGVICDENQPAFSLSFAETLTCGIRHKLSVKGLADLAGNPMRDTVLNISIPCRAAPHDIVIGEIMANPSPSVRLPEYEYVELYNRSDKNIELEGWTFTYGAASRTFPAYLFPAGSYLLLVHPDAVPGLAGYGATFPILGSLTAIANSGQYLQLADREGTVISWVDFDAEWYADPLKTGGGWSLEQTDPDQTCSLASGWKASTGRNGGTPGQKNSVHAASPVAEMPEFLRIAAPGASTIILYVSKPLGNTLPEASLFSIEPPVRITGVQVTGKHMDQLQLQLQSPLQEEIPYSLHVGGGIYDCAGYEVPPARLGFALPEYTDSLDVVINEILFNPASGGAAFIELYNRSQKAVQVSDLQLALRDGHGKLSAPQVLTADPFLLMPGKYLAVSRNTASVMQQFGTSDRAAFLKMPLMPSLTRESGRVVLLNRSLRIIDEVHYNSKQHADFLKNAAGVSLERLHPDRSSLDPGNWHTAAQTAGFGTPGKQNSQYTAPETSPDGVTLDPEVFSPDNDGTDDILNIRYTFDTPSLMAEVVIFDAAGRKIRQLANRQLLGTEGNITWDGAGDNGRKAPTGIYIIYFHVYNPDGFSKVFKIPCVVAGKRQ